MQNKETDVNRSLCYIWLLIHNCSGVPRSVPLVGRFKQYFLEVKQSQEQNKRLSGSWYNYEYDGYIFVDPVGNILKPNYLSAQFPRYLERHGLRRIRFHDLRHSCTSLLLANGVPLKSIQEWLGHSDFSTTANVYSHLDYSAKVASSIALKMALLSPTGASAQAG